MQSQAIELKAVKHAEREALTKAADALEAKAAPLRAQLAANEQAQVADVQAIAEATAALASALAGDDQSAIALARSRVAAASKAESKGSTRATEIDALKAAIEALNAKARPIGLRMMELAQDEQALTGQRLHEVAAEVGRRHVAALNTLAAVTADAQALNILAMRLGVAGNFGPLPYAVPSIIGENHGNSGRVVVDLEPLRRDALAALVARLKAEGFKGV